MQVALCYCQADRSNAVRLLEWMEELGPYPNHTLLLFRELKASLIMNRGGFGEVTGKEFADPYAKWPMSTTQAFQSVARYVEYTTKAPFLWLEPDCVPIRKGWLDDIAAEYAKTKKVFMGGLVPEYQGTPAHMSGIGVYPGEMTKYAGNALLIDEQCPFDITAAKEIAAQAHFTDLIVHRWDRPAKDPVKSMGDILKVITTETVLFHGDKGGSWIEVLRKERGTPYRPTDYAETDNVLVGAKIKDITPDSLGHSLGQNSSEISKDPVASVAAMFTSNHAKARIMKKLKNSPVIK